MSSSAAASVASPIEPTPNPTAVIQRRLLVAAVRPRSQVLEQSLTLDGRVVSIVGVTAPEFTGMIPGTPID